MNGDKKVETLMIIIVEWSSTLVIRQVFNQKLSHMHSQGVDKLIAF